MKKDETNPEWFQGLRQRAEELYQREVASGVSASPEGANQLDYEKRIHQIELDLQNEELCLVRDELLETRDRYSELYNQTPVGYMTVSRDGRIIKVNLALAEMLGVSRRTLTNKHFSTFITADDQNIYLKLCQEVIKTGYRQTSRLRLLRKAAEPLWVEIDLDPIEPAEEKSIQLQIIVTDISERRRYEQEKISLTRQMQHAQKLESLGVIAGGIAHEFNNLLMTILGNADLALGLNLEDSPTRDNLAEIELAAKQAEALTRQMLAYSGRGEFVVKPIDASELINEIEHLLHVAIPRKITLKYKFASNIPTFNGDVTQIRQIIMSLITNAAEAIGDNIGVITLSAGLMDCDRSYLDQATKRIHTSSDEPLPEGQYAFIEVADTGCGMDEKVIQNLFDPFFSTKFVGRGLGLAAVLGIVRVHKGIISVRSKVGKGAKFKVLFPANEHPDYSVLQSEHGDKSTDEKQGKRVVLVVDDEAPVRSVSQQMLERLGYDVMTAIDGRDALDLYHQYADQIACVLLDLVMPNMNGEETFYEMKRIRPEAKIILCTAYSEQDAIQHFNEKGLAGYIQKPFKIVALKEKLAGILADPSDCNGEGIVFTPSQ